MNPIDPGATIRSFSPGHQLFGRFTLVRMLGRGGMGVVWLARDNTLDREVALKFLPEMVMGDREAIGELRTETLRSLNLTHPHIVRIYDFLEEDELAAISMEYIPGLTLTNARLQKAQRHFETSEIATWVQQIGAALEYAHNQARVVHRDLKPANLMLNARGEIKITDFGIARSLSDSVSRISRQASSSGSPLYMSPQQLLGGRPTASDDIYSLGATIYELLTGKAPFHTGNILAQIEQVVPPSMMERRAELEVTGETIPVQWETVIAACLSKNPADRPSSIASLTAALNGAPLVLAGGTTQNPPSSAKSKKPKQTSKPDKGHKEHRRFPAGIVITLLLLAATAGALSYYFLIHQPRNLQQQWVQAEQAEAWDALQRKLVDFKPGVPRSVRNHMEESVQQFLSDKQHPHLEEASQLWQQHLSAWEEALRGDLHIRTIPAGAEIVVTGVGIQPSPAQFSHLRPGAYEVQIRAPGFDSVHTQITLADERGATPDTFTLQRQTGSLVIESEPEGLAFVLESLESPVSKEKQPPIKGVTPATLEQQPTGRYRVILSRPGWPNVQRNVEVTHGSKASIQAQFPTATISVTSNPNGLELFLIEDGKERPLGQTPLTQQLAPGTVDFVARHPRLGEARARASLTAGQAQELSLQLPHGEIEIQSNPTGAAIFAGDQLLGKTPLHLQQVSPGAVTLQARLDGHITVPINGTVTHKGTLKLHAILPLKRLGNFQATMNHVDSLIAQYKNRLTPDKLANIFLLRLQVFLVHGKTAEAQKAWSEGWQLSAQIQSPYQRLTTRTTYLSYVAELAPGQLVSCWQQMTSDFNAITASDPGIPSHYSNSEGSLQYRTTDLRVTTMRSALNALLINNLDMRIGEPWVTRVIEDISKLSNQEKGKILYYSHSDNILRHLNPNLIARWHQLRKKSIPWQEHPNVSSILENSAQFQPKEFLSDVKWAASQIKESYQMHGLYSTLYDQAPASQREAGAKILLSRASSLGEDVNRNLSITEFLNITATLPLSEAERIGAHAETVIRNIREDYHHDSARENYGKFWIRLGNKERAQSEFNKIRGAYHKNRISNARIVAEREQPQYEQSRKNRAQREQLQPIQAAIHKNDLSSVRQLSAKLEGTCPAHGIFAELLTYHAQNGRWQEVVELIRKHGTTDNLPHHIIENKQNKSFLYALLQSDQADSFLPLLSTLHSPENSYWGRLKLAGSVAYYLILLERETEARQLLQRANDENWGGKLGAEEIMAAEWLGVTSLTDKQYKEEFEILKSRQKPKDTQWNLILAAGVLSQRDLGKASLYYQDIQSWFAHESHKDHYYAMSAKFLLFMHNYELASLWTQQAIFGDFYPHLRQTPDPTVARTEKWLDSLSDPDTRITSWLYTLYF